MIESLSPFSRRLIALALLGLAILSALNLVIIPLLTLAGARLDRLEDARFRRARLEALDARPAQPRGDPVPPNAYFRANDASAAGAMLAAVVNGAAARTEVTIERAAPLPAQPARPLTLVVDLAASGPELTLVAFVSEIERGNPVIRLDRWRLVSPDAPGGPTRLEARAMAVWSARR